MRIKAHRMDMTILSCTVINNVNSPETLDDQKLFENTLTKCYWTQKYEHAKAIVVVRTILTDLLLTFC